MKRHCLILALIFVLSLIFSSCSKSDTENSDLMDELQETHKPDTDKKTNSKIADTKTEKKSEMPTEKSSENSTNEDSAEITPDFNEINRFKNELGAKYVTYISEPFVLYTNQSRGDGENYFNNYIKKTYELMFRQFMKIKPNRTLHIFLFRDEQSYTEKVKQILGNKPHTPYGFFISDKLMLMMNISTGSGTLVHELVHSFAHFDFPEIPLWCNEGLASLYEQSSFYLEKAGEKIEYLRGHKNWRYQKLLEGHKKNQLPQLIDFIHQSRDEFLYGQWRQYNAAYGRYLFYFMQENGWLEEFYNKYRDAYANNPSALPILEQVTDKNIDKLDKMFKQWIPNVPEFSNFIPK